MIASIDYTFLEALPFVAMALALTLTLRYQRLPDLTMAASFGLAPSVCAKLMTADWPVAIAVAISLLACGCLGLTTGILVTYLRQDPLLSGLVVTFVGYALALLFTQGSVSLTDTPNPFIALRTLDNGYTWRNMPLHPWQLTCLAGIAILLKLTVDRSLGSQQGLRYRTLEDPVSRRTLLASLGVSSDLLQCYGLIAANVLTAIAGILVAFKEDQANAQRGFDALLTVITAYLVGTALFERKAKTRTGAATTWSVLSITQRFSNSTAATLGLIAYFGLLQAMSRTSVPASVPKLMLGGTLIALMVGSKWPQISYEWRLRRTDKRTLVPGGDVFRAVDVDVQYPSLNGLVPIIRGASIEVRTSTIARLTGDNGSGKSTLLRYMAQALAGVGSLEIPSEAAPGTYHGRRPPIAYVPQDPTTATCDTLTAEEHIAMYQTSRPSWVRPWRATHSQTLLPSGLQSLLGMGRNDRLVASLSGGERQLLSLSLILAGGSAARVVLLDEPLNNLDQDKAELCVAIVEQLKLERRAVIIVQHRLNGTSDPQTAAPAASADDALDRLSRIVDEEISIEMTQAHQGSDE